MSDGELVLVATPIGNLGDLSPRAAEALAAADVIACEDTRHSRKLLTAAGIHPNALLAVHEHNEAAMAPVLLARLQRGERVVLITDAGTPAISDPGERLVSAAAAAGVVVSIVPGPSAAVAAVAVSGLPAARWCFEGFLPRKGSERSRRLDALAGERRTTVLYEAPHRLLVTLRDLSVACTGTRRVAVVRELTKVHEQVWRGTLDDAVAWAADPPPRGEIVVVLDGAAAPAPADDEAIVAGLRAAMAAGQSRRDAVPAVASALDVSRRRVYDLSLTLG